MKWKIDVWFDFSYISEEETVSNVRVKCNSEDITITVTTVGDQFNGMIYPKGLSKNSTCMTPYIQANSTVDYILPLRSCNTMNTDVVSMLQIVIQVVWRIIYLSDCPLRLSISFILSFICIFRKAVKMLLYFYNVFFQIKDFDNFSKQLNFLYLKQKQGETSEIHLR